VIYNKMMAYAPDWAWDLYRWSTNDRDCRTRRPSFWEFRRFQKALRIQVRGEA
jgi:hypothetical protein